MERVSLSGARSPPRSPHRLAPLLLLGITLARRGPMAVIALAISTISVVLLSIVGVLYARRSGTMTPVHDIPIVASSALAWGGGFLHAFSVAANALRRDRREGIRHLVVSRALTLRGYLVARIGGLAMLLAGVVAGGTAVVAAVTLLAAARPAAILPTLQAAAASVAYGVGFAVVIAPLAFAALGAKSRAGGYVALLGVLLVPELLAALLASAAPSEVTEVLALPAALGALRSSLAPGTADGFRFLRALAALGLFAAVAIFVVRREVLLLEIERAEGEA